MESTTQTPKPKRTQKRQPPVIKAVYPNGMTREEYQAELRKYAYHFARLFLQIYPNVLIQDEEVSRNAQMERR